MRIRLDVLSSGIIFLTACSHSVSEKGWEERYTMQEVEEMSLVMDSTMAQPSNYMQLVNDSTLAFLNKPTSEICVVSLEDGVCRQKIKIYQEGPDAINGIDGFYIMPEGFVTVTDSIWLYASWGQRIYRINSNGNLLESFEVPRTETAASGKYTVSPYPMTTTPYIVRGGNHYLQGMDGLPATGLEPGASLIYNPITGKEKTGTPYPAVYGEKDGIQDNWDAFAYRETFTQLLPDGDLITSFPASDSLYVWNPTTDEMSANLADYSERPAIVKRIGENQDEKFENFIKSFQYGAILYDSKNGLYYRLFRGAGEVDKNDMRRSVMRKPMGVIVLDKDFEKVGECMLPSAEYYPAIAFVASGTLYISILSEDDDFMKFRGFKVKEL